MNTNHSFRNIYRKKTHNLNALALCVKGSHAVWHARINYGKDAHTYLWNINGNLFTR